MRIIETFFLEGLYIISRTIDQNSYSYKLRMLMNSAGASMDYIYTEL